MKLQGKTAVITGGAAGIGRAVAERFAQEGAKVVLGDVNMELADAVCSGIRENGGDALDVYCNVSCQADCEALVKAAREAYGPIDILVNNAGGSIVGGKVPLFSDCTREYIDLMIGINLLGVIFCSRAVVNEMKDRRSGTIINMSSIRATVGDRNILYGTAKGGIQSFTRSLAIEMGRYGVTVNSISPGAIASREGPAAMKTYLGRPGQCWEVAALALFLASDEAGFITGENIVIDGGRSNASLGDKYE